MVKRSKRLKKSIESLKEQIEKHFDKLEKEIIEKDELTAEYHIKEIENSLMFDLKRKMKILGQVDEELLKKYKKRLDDFEKELE